MNDEPSLPSCVSKTHRLLEERLAHRPELPARLHHLLDTLDQSVVDGCDAHAAEQRVIEGNCANSARKCWATGPWKPTPTSRRRCPRNIRKPANTVKRNS